MKIRYFCLAVALAGTSMSVSAPAFSAATVLGTGAAYSCFRAASSKARARTGLEECNHALANEVLNHKDRAATYVNRGILHMARKDLKAAISDYDKALKISPKLGEAFVNKGIAIIHQGGNDAYAIELLSAGLALKPGRPEIAFYTRGIAHEMVGNAEQAYYDYQQASQLMPEWDKPREELRRFKVIED